MSIRSILLCSLFFQGLSILAQEPDVLVYGTVRDFNTRDSIPFPTILFQEAVTNARAEPVVTTARGRYEVQLNEEKVYWVSASAPGKVSKSVQIDTRGPSPEQWEGGFGMNIDIILMDSLPGVDFSILREPFGRCVWNIEQAAFEWDLDYTQAFRQRQQELIEAYKAAKR